MPMAQPPQLKAGLFARGSGAPRPTKPTATGAPAAKAPPGTQVEHRIGIQAPAEAIWRVIHDLAAWESWNPTYPKAAGEIRIGGVLDLTLALPGQAPMEIRPVVLDWVPNEQLHWKLRMVGGLVTTVRYIEIEAVSESGCIVSNGEYIGGLLGGAAVRRVGRSAYRGFLAMNEALKVRAEDLWQAGQV
ncbi:MAG TPA: SRPBCC domain-containing protein [Phenylobacterium sp.]|nr:SRPBCC domain-containing protein [Phenylobacterium sp.]